MLNSCSTSAQPELSVHVGTLRDVAIFQGIERAAFAGDRISRAEFAELARNEQAAVLLARYHGVAVGAAVLKRSENAPEDEANLYSLAVTPGFRRLGIARALLTRVVALASGWGASRVSLEVRPANLAAVAMYRAADFVTVGHRAGWYQDGSPALCMVRSLHTGAHPVKSIQ